MKKFIWIFLAACLVCFNSISQAADTFILDPGHTYVLWQISHLGFSTQAGKWYATGTLILDKDNPQNSKVSATINVADMVTGIAELDKHLKGAQFFDVAKFPNATFVSDKVDVTSTDTASVHGILTLRGVSKPVVLNVKLNKVGENPITHLMTVGFSATTTIKRSDFGLKAYIPMLGDDVELNIQSEATKPAAKG